MWKRWIARWVKFNGPANGRQALGSGRDVRESGTVTRFAKGGREIEESEGEAIGKDHYLRQKEATAG